MFRKRFLFFKLWRVNKYIQYNKAFLDPCDSILDSIWVELGWFFSFFYLYRIRVIILTPMIHQNLVVYRRSLTNSLITDSKRGKFNLYRINLKSIDPQGLIKKMGFCLFFFLSKKKRAIGSIEMCFCFLIPYTLSDLPVSELLGMILTK